MSNLDEQIEQRIINLMIKDVDLETHSNLDDADIIGTLLGEDFNLDFDSYN